MAQTTIQKKKKVSPKLNKILNDIGGLFGKLNTQVERAFKVGKEEGFTENEIAHLVREKMKQAGYGNTRIWQVLKESHPDVIGKQGPKNFHKVKVSDVTKAEKPFNALGLVKKAMSGLANTEEVKPRKSRFDELEEEEEAEKKQKHKVKYELEPEEKDFDELLAWENDLPGFPPQLLLRYTIQLIKLSRELQQTLNKLQMDARAGSK